jgi:hypothetical protein
MQTARDILRTSRLQGYQGGLQILGTGVQAGRESQITHPVDPGLLGEAWRLASQLVTEVCSNGAQGVVLHINNFENLSGDKEIQSTAHILRDLRDFFLTPHLHTIFVGTDDTLTTILTKYQQVRSILPFPEPLPALLPEDVTELIQRRYDYLQLPDREFIPPIEIKTAGYVYELFHGDLRGMLRSLEDAAVTLAGLGKDHPIEPIGFELITQLLQPMYIERFKSIVSEPLFKKFMILKELGLSMFTQTDLSDLWAVSVQRVSQLLPELERLGYIQSIGRDGRSRQYRLSGVGRLSLGLYGR